MQVSDFIYSWQKTLQFEPQLRSPCPGLSSMHHKFKLLNLTEVSCITLTSFLPTTQLHICKQGTPPSSSEQLMGTSQQRVIVYLILCFTAWHALLSRCWSLESFLRLCVAWKAPMESNRFVSGPKYHHLPPGFSMMHTGRLSWNFSHIDGTCPDPTLLFSREMTNHLRGTAPLAPATKSNRYQGQWKWRRAKDRSMPPWCSLRVSAKTQWYQ